MIEQDSQIADRLWEFSRMERQYRTVSEQAVQRAGDLVRFIEERKSRQRSLPQVRPTDRAAYVQRACDVVVALDQLTPRARYVQAGALYAANALSGEALRALTDEGSVSLENFQELFDLAGEALRLYDEVSFIRPAAGPAVELYLELASIWAASDGWRYDEFLGEFADATNTESDLARWQKYLSSARIAPLAARMRVLFVAEVLRRGGAGDDAAWARAQEIYEQAGSDIEGAVDTANDQEVADCWDVLLDRVRADGEGQTVALTPFGVDMVLAQAYDEFEPEPDGPPETSEALARLLNEYAAGADLPGDLWLGERETRINEAYRQRRQEEVLEAYLEHGRVSVEQALSLAPSIDAVRRRVRACRSLRFLALTVSTLGLISGSVHSSSPEANSLPLLTTLSLADFESIGGDAVRLFSLEVQAQDQQRVVPDFLIGGLEKAIFVWLELRARRQAQSSLIPVPEFTAAASGELEHLLRRPLAGDEDFVTLHGHVYYVVQVAEHVGTEGRDELEDFLSTPDTIEPLRAYHARGSGEWNERVRRLLALLAQQDTSAGQPATADGLASPPLRTSELKRRRRFQRAT
ncbi:MAG: hypothetical protein CL878_09660 [Dehalococcoidia bacterium]|nr:hypothetical protein [Dehalococcoidia bacterium]